MPQQLLALEQTSSAEVSTNPPALTTSVPFPARRPSTPGRQPDELGPAILAMLGRIAVALEVLCKESRRIADHVAPEPGDVVGTCFLAKQLGCTVVWVAEMARNGQIPKNCILPGTGSGKPWKFFRRRIEEWLNKR